MNLLISIYFPSSRAILFSEDHVISLFLHHRALSLSLVILPSNQRNLFFVLFLASLFHIWHFFPVILLLPDSFRLHAAGLSRITRHSCLQRLTLHSLAIDMLTTACAFFFFWTTGKAITYLTAQFMPVAKIDISFSLVLHGNKSSHEGVHILNAPTF